MNSKNPINVGASAALIELKAELHRKQGELKSSRSTNLGVPKSLKVKNEPEIVRLNSGKNRGIEKRAEKDAEEKKLEEKTYERAKSVLEAKAKLYDEMQTNALLYDEKEHPVLVNGLVDFQRKIIDRINEDRLKEPEQEDPSYSVNEEDWTEFTDSLGRTRRCLKTDLPDFIARDAEVNPAAALSPDEIVRLAKHEKWEKESEELAHKGNIHYQDVLFDEIRGHGVGYFGFAKDDATRAEQLQELKKLSQQTESSREKVAKERSQKKVELKERLRKVRQRKRAKLGLAPLEEKPDSGSEDERGSDETIKVNESLRDGEVKPLEEALTRPWDFGKPGVYGPKPVNFDELDAKWLKDRRQDRKTEFAPPSLYTQPSTSSNTKYQNFVKSSTQPKQQAKVYEPIPQYQHQPSTPIRDELPAPIPESSEDWKRGARAEVAPPPTFDYYHGDTNRRPPKAPRQDEAAVSDAIAQGVKAFREKFEEERKAKVNQNQHKDPFQPY